MTLTAQSLFLILQLFNCFTSACAGLHSLPVSLSLSLTNRWKTTFSPSLCPVQSFGSWISHARCIWWEAAKSVPMDHYSTLGEQNEPAGRERGREVGTELRDGVRYKNVKRKRMLNEQHRDEAVEEKALKECRGGVKVAQRSNSCLLSCQWQSSQFSFFFPQFQRWIPGTKPKPKPGTFLWLLPK